MILRKGQKELVEQYRGGYCAIPAIPGGGKTHCLSLWAVEMITKGLHRPGKILIVTYMNSAVNNFKQRISTELEKRGITGNSDYFVSTIHGLCLQIIKEKPDVVLTSDEFEVIDEVRKYELLDRSVEEWKKNNEDRFKMFVEGIQLKQGKSEKTLKAWHDQFCSIVSGAIGEFKCRGMNPVQALKKCRNLPEDSLLKCASEVYVIYDRNLKGEGYLDFDDMLYNAKRLLQVDKNLLEKYRSRYSFVCEDEAQDSNYIQSEVLTMIANGNLLRVGDSNQAICGTFTNSDFSYFKNFCKLPQTTVYRITQSSRSTKEIIDLANHFVEYVNKKHPVSRCRNSLLPQFIEPVDKKDPFPNPVIDEYGIKVAVFKSWENEADGVVRQAEYLVEKYPDKTLAILVPSSWKISYIVSLLESRNIPYYELGNYSGEKTKPLRILGRVLDYVALPHRGDKLAALFNECFFSEERIDKTLIDSFNKYLKSCRVKDILYPRAGEIDTSDVPEKLLNSKLWNMFVEKLDTIKEIIEYPTTVVEKLILFVAEKLEFGTEDMAIAQKVASEVRYLMKENWWSLSSFARDILLQRRNMFEYFCNVVWDLKGYEPEPGVVTVSTYHKAKGLEWDHVFLTNLNYDDFPVTLKDKFKGEYWYLKQEYRNPKALIKADMNEVVSGATKGDSLTESKYETISEKARLLYVGITRAKERLFMSAVRANRGRKNEVLPSRYLMELKTYIDQKAQNWNSQN